MKNIKISFSAILKFLLILTVGFFIGWLVRPVNEMESPSLTMENHVGDHPTTWTCSMHPQIRQSEPGSCPLCGMDLIPVDDQSGDDSPGEIRMSATAMALANVQTEIVGLSTPVKEIRVNGKVFPDERLIYSQVTHLDGRVEELAINFTGESVRKGQRIAGIYSPELVTAQEELFSAQKIQDTQPGLFQAAKEKLKNWKLTDEQIESILQSGKAQEQFPIMADVSGIVMEKKVNLGDYVSRGMPLYEITDLSRVWVLFDVYETDLSWVRIGSQVSFTISSLPGESFSGKIIFIDPVINPRTRVATARVEIRNLKSKLKPEMFASGVVKSPISNGKKESLMIPKTAVMWTGSRSVVYEKKESDSGISFQLLEVELGPLVGDHFVVKDGLEAGTEIAVNGTFSIDAAAQLAGKPSMMNPGGGAAMTGHQHGDIKAPMAVTLKTSDISIQTKAAVQKLVDRYIPLKDALVKDDLTEALKGAGILKKEFEATNMNLFTGEAHNYWMIVSKESIDLLNQFISAKNIEEARQYFKPLSIQMVGLVKNFGPFESAMYVQHCPMADSNTGADWLSFDKEILNPYFGDKMLKCGSITETIVVENK